MVLLHYWTQHDDRSYRGKTRAKQETACVIAYHYFLPDGKCIGERDFLKQKDVKQMAGKVNCLLI